MDNEEPPSPLHGAPGAVAETTRKAVLLAIKAMGTNAERVARAERERDLLLDIFGPPTMQQKEDGLLRAADRGDHRAVARLLGDGVTPDGTGPDMGSTTALMNAARNGHLCCIEALLEGGACVNRQNFEGWTSLHFAARGPRKKKDNEYTKTLSVIEMLLEAGGDRTIVNRAGRLAWQEAALGGHTKHSPVMALLKK